MRRQIKRTLLIILGIGSAVIPIHSQTKPQKPSFEVASVKPSPPREFNLVISRQRRDGLSLTGASLKGLMGMAYRDSATGDAMEIFGGPAWMESALYDVQAKADCSGGIISRDQMALMVQSLLEDRFQLKAHVETRELPVYNLVVGKDGPKLKPSADQTPAPIPVPIIQTCGPAPETPPPPSLPPLPPPGTDMAKFMSELSSQLPRGQIITLASPTEMTLQGRAAPISRLLFILKLLTGRQVIDKTGLTGLFDIMLKFSPDGLALPGRPPGLPVGPVSGPPSGPLAGPTVNVAPMAEDPAATLFSAIQDLGLKLEQARGPVQVVVIDSVQRPSEN
jgi:uncharacterized protein (TIGR03435 family)